MQSECNAGDDALMRKWSVRVLVAGVAVFGLIQLVPYGRNHTNPPVRRSVKWDSARTEELARGACLDCHSNLTTWPWYSNIAPVSWLVYADVQGGRGSLNFSANRWRRLIPPSGTSPRTPERRTSSRPCATAPMPPWQYKPTHPAGRLSNAERTELANGLAKTLAADPPNEPFLPVSREDEELEDARPTSASADPNDGVGLLVSKEEIG